MLHACLLQATFREAMRFTESRVGYCGQTELGGDCDKGHLGSWAGARTLHACAKKCSDCARCAFVSFSAQFGDCSWYSSCDAVRSGVE